jgi:signal transduction histidine kinase
LLLFVAWIAVAFASTQATAEPPRTVLLLDQSDPNAPWGIGYRDRLRTIIGAKSSSIGVYIELADIGRFGSSDYEALLREYLRGKYRDKPIGVIVANGSRMFDMALRLRDELWPDVPLVFSTVDGSGVEKIGSRSNVTGAILQVSLFDALKAARDLVPGLKRVVHVGSHWERQPFFHFLVRELPELAKKVEVEDLAGVPLEQTKRRVSSLPYDTAIIYTSLYAVGAGTSLAPIDALGAIAAVANRPIVSFSGVQIGVGATGGYVTLPGPVGTDAAARVLRILDGEPVSSIPITVGDFARPVFDWRKLQQFGIDLGRLPPGSDIRFRELTMWEEYHWQLSTIFAVVIGQALLISGLLWERRRRQAAEVLSRRRFLEVMHLNRAATASAMSASIAHELNQPLGAILSNAEAARNLLARNPLDVEQIKAIVDDILRDDQRAADIIGHVRGLLKRRETKLQDVDINAVLGNTLPILETEAAKRDIALACEPAAESLQVRADPVHLQQALLNLAINGMDAIQAAANADRRLIIESHRNGGSTVEISVADTGAGIPANQLEGVFDTFFTTKPDGTGLGLSIARTIIESYKGRLWAENGASGGAVFRLTLPLVETAKA